MGFLSDGSPLAYKFAGLPAEVVAGVKETLEAGFAAGWNPKKVAREVQKTFDGALTNAKVTCRTEYMRAYRTASHETYRANSDVCTGWIWMCARQARTCAACWAMDGTEHPLSERMTDHPGGRCTQIPMTKSWAEITGRDVPGVTETSAKGWDPEPAFREMSASDQFKVLGPRRYALWKDGKIGLRDMATLQRSTVWGNHYRPTTVAELVAGGKVTWEDIHAARSASRIAPKKTGERKAELTSFAKSAELTLKEITKTESKWSGKLHFRSMTRAAGRKDWNCDITLHPGYTKEAKNAYPTINHEMFHALSVGLTPEAYRAHPGWEEGVVEQLQRIHGSKVKDAAGMAHTGSWSYQAYIDSHETIRGFLGVDKERYYVKLLRTPLEKRRTLVERALKKTPVPPGVQQAIERLDEYT